jgi:hypothetical protein
MPGELERTLFWPCIVTGVIATVVSVAGFSVYFWMPAAFVILMLVSWPFEKKARGLGSLAYTVIALFLWTACVASPMYMLLANHDLYRGVLR